MTKQESRRAAPVVTEGDDGMLRWHPPSVNEEDVSPLDYTLERMPTAEQFEQWERESREQGYADGYAEGVEKGRVELAQELSQHIDHLSSIMKQLVRPLQNVDRLVEEELMQLVVTVAQQVVRRELKVNPGEIIGCIRECLNLLPSNTTQIVLHLHPEDAELVRSRLAEVRENPDWQIREDPLLTRGGCKVTTERSMIDATVEAQLQRLAAVTLNRSRDDD